MPVAFAHRPFNFGKLKSITQFDVVPDSTSPEWFRLRSAFLTNKQLFQMLEAVWPAIVGPEHKKFALIHCQAGRNAGVWFHLLPHDDYEPGCHEVRDF